MDYSISNHQDALAELFVLNEIQINFSSYEAILSIKRWKFITKIPGIAPRSIRDANENIQKNFFSYMSNNQLLVNESYFSDDNKN